MIPTRKIGSSARWLSILLLAFALALASCSEPAGVTPTPLLPAPETPELPPTPTPGALGSTDNPLVIGFVSVDGDPEIDAAAKELAVRLTVQTGYAVQSSLFSSYPELVAHMRDGQVHAAWMHPLTYIYAQGQKFADVALLSNHFGTFFYGAQFLANVESGYISYYDPAGDQVTADGAAALPQLDGARPCWVAPESISGYVLPLGILRELGVDVQDGVIMRSSTALVRALYIKGVCDFGATFAFTGDPRTSSAVSQDLTDVVDRVMVIWRTDPIIPSLNFSLLPNIPSDLREAVTEQLISMVKNEEGRALLTQALDYDVQDLRTVDDSIYDPIRGAAERARIPLQNTIGQ